MEDAEEEDEAVAPPPQDDEFAFNAPTFYDLKNPQHERQYVNNADGYFFATPQRTSAPPPLPFPPLSATPQTPFGRAHEPPAHANDVDTEMVDDHEEEDDRMSDGGSSEDTLVLESLETPPKSAPAFSSSSALPPAPAPRGHSHSSSAGVSSSLLQPTKSFLMRMQAERERAGPNESADQHHHHVQRPQPTHPRSPQLRTSQRQHSNEPKLSSTSRELLKIQEEKNRVQQETQKAREYHARVRAQRVPTNVHQRSTKQLTIPQSPYLEVGHRSRRALNTSMTSSEENEAEAPLREEPHPYIAPEQFLSREFEFPASRSHHNPNGPQDVTVPHTPQLRTSERAARRNVFPQDEASEQPAHRVDYSKMKVNGVTRPISPQFETDRRAAQAASYRKPIEVVDKDAEELHRKFHARPVPRQVLEAPKRLSPQTTSKPALTKPVSPKLSTSARARMHAPPQEDHKEEKKALSSSNGSRRTGPTVPETPPLRSLQRHRMYQENLRLRQEAEAEEMRRQREFKAQPLRITTTPPKFEGSKKPLTEVQPFALRGDHLRERAQERIERKRREEEEQLRMAANFRAMPMPDLSPSSDDESSVSRAPARSLTKPSSPKFATDRRAAERAAFEAAERQRRARDEEEKRRMDEEKRRQEEEQIKRMRREQLTFHARPVPSGRPAFEVKPSSRTLTEPESPHLQTKVRGGSATTTAA
jgi:hypothetical protein